jgi:fido (protein-threonine AMPylation protein)
LGRIRKIAPRIYSSNLTDLPADIIRRNLIYILGRLYPGAVLSHRTAIEMQPTEEGHIFITHSYTKKIPLPGVVLRFLKGYGPLEGDPVVSGGLHASQNERALLENMEISRRSGGKSKSLGIRFVEEKVEKIAMVRGEAGLNELRHRTRDIAQRIGLEEEFAKLDLLIAKRLKDKPSKALESPAQMVRTFGHPYDPNRQTLFESLFASLRNEEFADIPDRNITGKSLRNIGFFDAWLSCHFDGIQIDCDDAMLAVESDRPLPDRLIDSQTLLHIFRMLVNRNEMAKVPQTHHQLLEFMQHRHRTMLRSLASRRPGEIREENQYGDEAFFIDHALIRGSLNRAFELYQGLRHPFARAAFMMFMIGEVKPFLTGNGLIARAMMNAELVHASQQRIIFPLNMQDDLTDALRLFTLNNDPSGYVETLQRIRNFSAGIFGEDISHMRRQLS